LTRRHFLGLSLLFGCSEEDMNIKKLNWWMNGGAASLDPNVVLVGLCLGQSNESGRGEKNRMLGLTSYVANPSGVKIFYKPVFVSDVVILHQLALTAINFTNLYDCIHQARLDCQQGLR